ncbi:hypothetical protein ACQU0X_06530 [Pseudovibrio ascidiaceicola]|uniref:hypothetical protein n=1 Tax=Pseudovibrio ascidiaceicola TaxID=285279 RepID=UPI003D35A17F
MSEEQFDIPLTERIQLMKMASDIVTSAVSGKPNMVQEAGKEPWAADKAVETIYKQMYDAIQAHGQQ